ncbi:MAG: SlyX family protein [Ectothiorhodospiraceae bacterium]|jgi:SlyX protein
MSDESITALEEKLAHQELAISELSDALYQQQRRIEALESLCDQLVDRIRRLGEDAQGAEQAAQKPPHY